LAEVQEPGGRRIIGPGHAGRPEYRETFFLQGTVLQALGRRTEAARALARVKQLSERDVARQRDLFSEQQP